MRTPFMLVGDGPAEATGLGRIARDLGSFLSQREDLDFVQVGGELMPPWTAWRHFPLDRQEDWGAPCVQAYWRHLFGDRPGILFVIWDPGRLWPYCQLDLPVQRWAYTAIDGGNINGEISGPAGAAVRAFDRVLAYGRYGSRVLKSTLQRPISYLPHGLTLSTYTTPATEDEQAWVASILGPFCRPDQPLIGSVMTNQPRKDLSLFFRTLRELRDRGRKIFGWLHTDVLVKDWSVQQLVEDFGLEKACRITVTEFTDRQLACLYQRCAVTVLPSLGEGFGYPIVESLASGVPVVHSDCAGGAELVPKTEWRVPVRAKRLESIYAIERPVFDMSDFANAVCRAMDWTAIVGPTVSQAYCRGTVAALDWNHLWPRWATWIGQGLAA